MSEKTLHQKRIDTALNQPSLQYTGISIVSYSLNSEDIDYLAERIPQNNRIASLQLSGNHLHDDAIPALIKTLDKLPALERLDISYNNFTAEGIATLREHLPELRDLDVSRNRLGEKGGEVLADYLKSPKLRFLEAADCSLKDDGTKQLIDALRGNRTLFHVNFAQNDASVETSRQAIDSLLKDNRSLTRISIDQQAAEDHGNVSAALRKSENLNLTKLNVITEGSDVTGILGAPVHSNRLVRNFEVANDLRKLIRSDWQKLSGRNLRDIEQRHNAVFDPSISNLGKGRLEEYDAFVANLPPMPVGEASLPDALYTPDAQGFAPLDNPRLLTPQNRDAFFASVPLDAASVTRRTERGTGLLDVISRELPAKSLVAHYLDNGLKLGSRELLDDAGKPNELLATLIEKQDVAPLFSLDNWQGKSRSELHKVYSALPQELQGSIGYFALAQQMKAAKGTQDKQQGAGR